MQHNLWLIMEFNELVQFIIAICHSFINIKFLLFVELLNLIKNICIISLL